MDTLAALAAIAFVFAILVAIAVAKSLLYVGRPNELLIFSGRDHKQPDGSMSGYRYMIGGRMIKYPFLESVQRMDLRILPIAIKIEGAYSRGGIPLTVHAIANVKVSSYPGVVDQAIERFLNHDRDEVMRVARETLEGNLRGVLATLTPEQVNEDRLRFVDELQKDAEPDFEKLGLHLDTLKIQSVSDDRDYLDSIGRLQIAEIVKQAEVAESNAVKEATEIEAEALGRSEVALRKATAQIQRAENQLRQLTAELDLEAKSEEERTAARALAARAEAEQELQKVRTDLETIRLEADVVIPARAQKSARELIAAGEAASITERGRATAEVMREMMAVWQEAGDAALDVFMLNRIEEIMIQVARAAKAVEVRQVALIDSGDGTALPNYVASFPKIVSSLLGEMRETMGIDIAGAIRGPTESETSRKGAREASRATLSDAPKARSIGADPPRSAPNARPAHSDLAAKLRAPHTGIEETSIYDEESEDRSNASRPPSLSRALSSARDDD